MHSFWLLPLWTTATLWNWIGVAKKTLAMVVRVQELTATSTVMLSLWNIVTATEILWKCGAAQHLSFQVVPLRIKSCICTYLVYLYSLTDRIEKLSQGGKFGDGSLKLTYASFELKVSKKKKTQIFGMHKKWGFVFPWLSIRMKISS